MRTKRYRLPDDAYDPSFIKALACAIQMDKLDPSELEFWIEDGRDQLWMAKELYNRVKPVDKKKKNDRRSQASYDRYNPTSDD